MEFSLPAFMAFVIVRIFLGAVLPAIFVGMGVHALSKNPSAAMSFGGATFLVLLSLAQ